MLDTYDAYDAQQAEQYEAEVPDPRAPIGIGTLIENHPHLQEPVIHGLLRVGETANIIAPPKVGKSWLAYDLALSVAIGSHWLGKYLCQQGRALIVDNELHKATLASRIPTVARALEIQEDDYHDKIDVLSLRGHLMDLVELNRFLARIEPDTYSIVILDAWYRCIPTGISENDNGAVANLYNLIDGATARLKCSWVNIHHASKGSQGDKVVTDVGAGAGSQSRAADSHIVLRPHEEDGVVVLDAVVRSFPPVEPLPLRWNYPCWHPADDIDPAKLRGRLTRGEQRQRERDTEGLDAIKKVLAKGDATAREIRTAVGYGKDRCDRLLYRLTEDGAVTTEETSIRGNKCLTYHLTGDVV